MPVARSVLARLRPASALVAVAVLTAGAVLLAAPAASGQPRGQGTMLIRQSVDCSGTGTAATVRVPFSVLFTGFDADAVGTIQAFAMPSGEFVGEGVLELGPDGERCYTVKGDAQPGMYKLVYDFGSGTGKQKVIRVVADPEVQPTPTETTPEPTDTPTASESPDPTPTTTSPEPTSSESTETATTSPTDTGSAEPADPESPSTDPDASTETSGGGSGSAAGDGDPADLRFRPVRGQLAATGGQGTLLLAAATLALIVGMALVAGSRWPRAGARRH